MHKHFVIVRPDLPIGLLASQVCHAAGESAALRTPPEGTHAVILSADEAELLRLECVLSEAAIPHVAVRENDAPYAGALMAIGVAPLQPGVSRWLRHLRLLR